MTMMSTRARGQSLLSHFGSSKQASALTTLYFALYRGDPFGAGTEPDSTGGYARAAVTNNDTLWGGAISTTATQITNGAAITWPQATGLYSITDPLNYWAVFDNTTGGTLWYGGPLNTPITVTGANDTPRLAIGALTIYQAG